MIYTGSCHCGAVAYEVEADEELVCVDCNCSICLKSGNLHLIVPKSKFKLLRGKQSLSAYIFDSGEAKHLFCSTCGLAILRSEERRVGKECRSRWSPYH